LPAAHTVSLVAQALLAQHWYPATPQITQLPPAQMVLALEHWLLAQHGCVLAPQATQLVPLHTVPGVMHSLFTQQPWFRPPQATPVPVWVPVLLPLPVRVLFPVLVPVPVATPVAAGASVAASGLLGVSPFFQHKPSMQLYLEGQALAGGSEQAMVPLTGWGSYLQDTTTTRPKAARKPKLRFRYAIRTPPWQIGRPCPGPGRAPG
jgi:hypothetical protein